MAKFDKVIPPGQEGKVNLVIEGKKVAGSFSKSATIHCNDPKKPVVTVSLVGNEIPYVDVQPTRVFLQGRYGEKIEKTVALRSNEENLDLKVTSLSSNIDDKITYKADQLEDGSYELHIWKNPKLPTLNTYGSLIVNTNSEHSPETVVQVQVVTKGSITVQPSTVNFGGVQFAQRDEEANAVHKNVTLIRSQGEFAIRDIEFSSDRYEANLAEVVPGKRYNVEVTFHPPVKKLPRQREVGEMIIHTDDPNEPTLRVKLVARAM